MIVSAKRVVGLSPKAALSPNGLESHAPGKSFKEVLHSIDSKAHSTKIPADPFQAMNQLTERVLRGDKLNSRELLLYQVKAGQFGMHVELISKVAESGSASVRKLQNQG